MLRHSCAVSVTEQHIRGHAPTPTRRWWYRRSARLRFSMIMASQERPPPPQSPSPTITHHPSPPLLPTILPPQIAHSAVAGAHYSGTNSSLRHRRISSGDQPARAIQSLEDVHASRQRIMNDLKELYCCRPTLEIFERTWRRDSVFEVCIVVVMGRVRAFYEVVVIGPLGEMRGLRRICSPGTVRMHSPILISLMILPRCSGSLW